jgi:Spy/CpxP family protein refolding chaperone
MRKIALVAAFAALTGATALHAQAGGAPPEGRGRGPGGRGGPGMMLDRQLLQSITLTDAQQAKLEELRKSERDQMEAQRGQGNPAFEAIREAREKGDTATARQLMEQQRAQMDVRRDKQIAAIRGILTSDQYAQFDANVAELKKREAERGPGMRGRGPRPPRA